MEKKISNILIADDNVHVRKFLIRELDRPNYRLFEADNHQQLFSVLYNLPEGIDLVVLDPYMPYLHGIEILRRLQKITPPVPVIVYTCTREHQDHPVVKQTSAFVEKDGDIGHLQETIARLLQNQDAVFDTDLSKIDAGPDIGNQRDR